MHYFSKDGSHSVEAFQFYVDNIPDWFADKISTNEVVLHNCDYKRYSIDEASCTIKVLSGKMTAKGGNYILKGKTGNLYPVSEANFSKNYRK